MNPAEQKSTVSEAVRKHGKFLFPAVIVCFLFFFVFIVGSSGQTTSLKFEMTIAKGLISAPQKGRLFVFVNRKGEAEPRLIFDDGDVGLDAPPIFAKDVMNFKADETRIFIDSTSISYP